MSKQDDRYWFKSGPRNPASLARIARETPAERNGFMVTLGESTYIGVREGVLETLGISTAPWRTGGVVNGFIVAPIAPLQVAPMMVKIKAALEKSRQVKVNVHLF